MKVLNKLTIKNLKLNKKRSIGTIIGIMLSVALICAISNMVSSFRESLVQNAIKESGYYHIKIDDVTDEKLKKLKLNKDIENIEIEYKLGYSKISLPLEKEYPYIEVHSLEKNEFDKLSYQLIEGRLPNNSDEIVISKKIKLKGNYQIGDTLDLNVGERVTDEGYVLNNENPYLEENNEIIKNPTLIKYKIVGVVYKVNVDNAFYGITTNNKTNSINTYISLKNPGSYKESFVEILNANSYEDVINYKTDKNGYGNYSINNELLRWEAFKFSDSTINMLSTVAAIVILIVIFTSVFCIRNSFAISTTEKIKMYGMLSSIGATKKQIKNSVLKEGIILGLIAIPLGIILGISGIFILLKIVNLLVGDFILPNISGLCFKVSGLAIVISIILGFVTIYFSAISSARKAGKISPIDNLRGSSETIINNNKLKTPKFIKSRFKMGGVLAYKNLKRSKKKYRTTVISLAVSVFVFISMFSFTSEGFKESGNYYKKINYNFVIYFSKDTPKSNIEQIRKFSNIKKSYLTYQGTSSIKITDFSKVNTFYDDNEYEENSDYKALQIILMDDNTFKEYVKNIKGNYNDLKDKGILIDTYKYYAKKEGDKKSRYYEERRYKFNVGDVINSNLTDGNSIKVQIGSITDTRPYGLENTYYNDGYIILNGKYFNNIEYYPYILAIDSSNTEELGKDIDLLDEELRYYDLAEEAEIQNSMIMVISIFLYGFIGVITLIGITNIFNTITSNMELRQKEFAMLKSIGMTKKEFRNMINLETLFYCTKSLLYGIIAGLGGAFAIHKALGNKSLSDFVLPYNAIILSIVFVFIIVYIIMQYSINKINKQNTIETIRKENI